MRRKNTIVGGGTAGYVTPISARTGQFIEASEHLPEARQKLETGLANSWRQNPRGAAVSSGSVQHAWEATRRMAMPSISAHEGRLRRVVRLAQDDVNSRHEVEGKIAAEEEHMAANAAAGLATTQATTTPMPLAAQG
jgi:hypothetical protein